MRSDWTTLDSWLFLAALLYILGVAGGLEAGALSFGEWAVHTLGGAAVTRCEKRPCGTTCEKVAAWHDKIEGLKSAEREGLQQARDAEHLLRRAR